MDHNCLHGRFPSMLIGPRLPASTCRLRLLMAAMLLAPAGWAQEYPVVRMIGGKEITLHAGHVMLSCEAASIDIPPGMVFLSYADARYVVELLWRNPLDAGIVGLILPEDSELARDPNPPARDQDLEADAEAMPVMPPPDPGPGISEADDGWATVITWTEGHIREQEVRDLDYDRILAAMRAAMPQANAAQRRGPIPSAELVGWAAPPYYDAVRHTLVWAKSLRFYYGDAAGPNRREVAAQINHCAYLLGARGVLAFTTIADASELPQIVEANRAILARTATPPGQRYEDFRTGIDPEYDGDLAARIAGGHDPGNLDLAVKTRHALWLITCLVLAALIGLVVFAMSRRARLLSLPAATGAAPQGSSGEASPHRCARCGQPLHLQVARCPACGASNVARTDRST